MSKKSTILLFLLVLAPVIIYFLWPSDESRIKKLIKQGAEAIEKKNIDEVMSKVSFNYQDDYGLNYIYIKKILEAQLNKMSDIKVEYENPKVLVHENSATAELDVKVIATIGENTGYILGDIKSPVHLKLTLEKERSKWLVVKTEGLPFQL